MYTASVSFQVDLIGPLYALLVEIFQSSSISWNTLWCSCRAKAVMCGPPNIIVIVQAILCWVYQVKFMKSKQNLMTISYKFIIKIR